MKTLLFLGNIGTGEVILIALVVLLLWGGKKIPELMKGLGKGVKSFKEGMNEIEKDIKDIDAPKTEDKDDIFVYMAALKDEKVLNYTKESYKI